MQRSVIQLAGRTFVVSLPSKWCKKNAVTKGDLLDVTEGAGFLRIDTKAQTTAALHVVLDVSGQPSNAIWHAVNSAYRSGASTIEVRFSHATIFDHRLKKDTTMLALAHRMVQRLTGMELTTHGKKHFIMHEVGSPEWRDFEGTYARLLQLVQGLYEEAATVEPTVLDDTIQLFEDQINRVADLCERIIARSTMITTAEAVSYVNIVKALEQLGDEAKNTASQRQLCMIHPAVKAGLKALHAGTPHAAMTFHKEKTRFKDTTVAERTLSVLTDALNARQTLFHSMQRTQ